MQVKASTLPLINGIKQASRKKIEINPALKDLEFQQGDFGDCAKLAMLYLLSRKKVGLKFLSKIFKEDGFFKFPTSNQIINVSENEIKPDQATAKNLSQQELIRYFEVAYSKLVALTENTGIFDKDNPLSFARFGNLNVFKNFTGVFGKQIAIKAEDMKDLINKAIKEPERHFLMVAITENCLKAGNFRTYHAYAIKEINKNSITLIDPHDTLSPITISKEKFFEIFDGILGGVLRKFSGKKLSRQDQKIRLFNLFNKAKNTAQHNLPLKTTELPGNKIYKLKKSDKNKYSLEFYEIIRNEGFNSFLKKIKTANNEVKEYIAENIKHDFRPELFEVLISNNPSKKIITELTEKLDLISGLPEINYHKKLINLVAKDPDNDMIIRLIDKLDSFYNQRFIVENYKELLNLISKHPDKNLIMKLILNSHKVYGKTQKIKNYKKFFNLISRYPEDDLITELIWDLTQLPEKLKIKYYKKFFNLISQHPSDKIITKLCYVLTHFKNETQKVRNYKKLINLVTQHPSSYTISTLISFLGQLPDKLIETYYKKMFDLVSQHPSADAIRELSNYLDLLPTELIEEHRKKLLDLASKHLSDTAIKKLKIA